MAVFIACVHGRCRRRVAVFIACVLGVAVFIACVLGRCRRRVTGGLLSLHASCAVAVVGCCHFMRRVLSLWWAAVTACVVCCRCGGLLSLHASCAVAVVGCCHCMRHVLSLWWAAVTACVVCCRCGGLLTLRTPCALLAGASMGPPWGPCCSHRCGVRCRQAWTHLSGLLKSC